jgi:alpha-beta hydrolase superfamily lysophospholipase
LNSRGMEMFIKSWMPKEGRAKGIIFLCHGYADTVTFFFEGLARIWAAAGYAVFGMDYPGFGLSEGLHGYVPNFDNLVDDVVEQYRAVKGTQYQYIYLQDYFSSHLVVVVNDLISCVFQVLCPVRVLSHLYCLGIH